MKDSENKLNIAMICDPASDDNKAGAIVSAIRFGKIMQERGHKVIFIGAKMKGDRKNDILGMKTYRFRSVPLPKSGGWSLAFPTSRELKDIFKNEQINVVHIILPMTGALVAVRVAKKLGIKIIAHSHSQPENLFMDMPRFTRPTLDATWNRILAWLYDKGEAVIYPSELAHNLLSHLVSPNKPFHVISNGVNIKEYKPVEVNDFRRRFNIDENAIVLFYVGRLFPEKSIDTLIRAIPKIYKNHSNLHVVIAGRGHLLDDLKNLSKELGVDKLISFISPISDSDKILAYNTSDIFVSPSLAELEGMTTLEAMACGKPIIVPNTKMNATRYFVDGNGLLFNPLDYEGLAGKVISLIEDEDLRKKMGRVSLESSAKYDIYTSAERLEDAYYSILNGCNT